MRKKSLIIDLVLQPLLFAIIFFTYFNINNLAASIELFVLAVALFIFYWKSSNKICNAKSFFALFWFGTIGLSCLQLHPLQTQWKAETWICLFLAFYSFSFGYNLTKENNAGPAKRKVNPYSAVKLIFILSVIAFVVEFLLEGYIPLFSRSMSSYKEFGITGIHYFTVSSFLIPIFSIIHIFDNRKKIKIKNAAVLLIANIYAFALPILIVGRQLLIMTIAVTLIVLLYKASSKGKIKHKIFIISLVALAIGGWGLISSTRNQSDEYIRSSLRLGNNSVLSTKQLQAYTYIALNYDNFNYNVGNLTGYSYGTKSTFPLFALTGLKFVFNVSDSGYHNIIPTYTTMPIIIAPYMDFGIIGIVLYMVILGYVCKKIGTKEDSTISAVQITLMLYSLAFAFFYPTFSEPNVIFNFLYISAINLFLSRTSSSGIKKIES